jgi:hypothetical protein
MPVRKPRVLAPNDAELANGDTLFTGWLPPPQGRLTLTSGTPAMTATVQSGATVYYTPHAGDLCPIWDGTKFIPVRFPETSQTLSDATKSPAAAAVSQVYDLFGWLDGSIFRATRGPTWAAGATAGSNVLRGAGAGSTALTRVNGFLANQFSITNGPAAGFGLYLGTIATDSSGATVTFDPVSSATGGGLCSINLWNVYNQAPVSVFLQDTTATHTYSSSTIRAFNASAQNAIYFVRGLNTDGVEARLKARLMLTSASGGGAAVGIGLNSMTAFATQATPAALATAPGASASVTGTYAGLPGLGVSYFAALEQSDGSNAHTFYGGAWMSLTASMRF